MIIIIMSKQFVNRGKELQWLKKIYHEEKSSLIILYGRRRVGKTELIKQFSNDKNHVYFLASMKPEQENRLDLQKLMADHIQEKIFERIEFRGWEDMFHEFMKRAKKPLIVIDEFPYLIEKNKAIPSIFQKIWDEHLKDQEVMLVLCGSSIGMMETEVLGYRSPLYGRRTGQWKVEPFTFRELAEFFPGFSFDERLKFYSFLDGIPEYVNKMDLQKNPEWNLKNRFFKRGEYLYEEAENLLRQEFREPSNYFSILHAVSEGNTRYGDICNRTGFSQSLVSQYMKNLIDLRVVKKEFPATQKKESRNALYSLADNYYDFWFEFVYPYRSLIEEDKQETLMTTIDERLRMHYSSIYERVCREAIWHFPVHFDRVGRWWHGEDEIDVVGVNEKEKIILLGECKWSKKVVGKDLLADLEQKSEKVTWKIGKRTERFVLFSKSGFTEELKDIANTRKNVELFTGGQIDSLLNRK